MTVNHFAYYTKFLDIVDHFQFSDKDYDSVLRHPNPARKNVIILGNMQNTDGFGVGQFVNDASKPNITGEEGNFISAVEELEKYEDRSHCKVNCQIDEQLWFVAIKNIKAGEELFCHYGFQFWVAKYLQQAKSPQSKLLIYSLFNQDTQPFNLGKLDNYDEYTCSAFLTDLLGVSTDRLSKYKSSKSLLLEMMELNQAI